MRTLRDQLQQMQTMGGLGGPDGHDARHRQDEEPDRRCHLDDKVVKRQMAVIDSMTREERKNPDILKASRKKRIAAGAGLKVEEVNKLLKMHRNMADMMKAMGQGKRGPLAGMAQMMGSRRRRRTFARTTQRACSEDTRRTSARSTLATERFPGLPGLGKPTLPGLGGFPGLGKKK